MVYSLFCIGDFVLQENEIYFVLQAEKASWNSIGIFKVSNITGKRRELVPGDMDTEGSDSDTDSEDEGVDGSGKPILQVYLVL